MHQYPLGVNLTIDGHIATLTLNQPQRHNSLAAEDIGQLHTHLTGLSGNPDVRVVIVTGSGNKSFCAGAALGDLGSGTISGEQFADVASAIAALPMPTIGAMNGSAYGGGAEIGLACDFRIGVRGMRLLMPPARIGLCYPASGIERFVRVLGPNMAKRLLLASEEFSGEQLLELGYLTQLIEAESLLTSTRTLAERLAGYAPLALKAMKTLCDNAAQTIFNLTEANRIASACNRSEDLQEGFRALQEKRPPHFQGR